MTTFLSRPCGRGGAGGTSPAAMRSVQSAKSASARSRPSWSKTVDHLRRPPALTAGGVPTPPPRTGTCQDSAAARACPCSPVGGTPSSCPTSRCEATAPDSPWSARYRCLSDRCPETRSCRGLGAAKTNSPPDSTRLRRAGSAQRPRSDSAPCRAWLESSANRRGRSPGPRRCSSLSAGPVRRSVPARR